MNRLRGLVATLLLCLSSLPAGAHSLSVAHLDAEAAPDGAVTVDLDLAVRDLALAFELDSDADERVTWSELEAAYPVMSGRVLEAVAVSRSGARCPLRAGAPGLRRYDDGAYARFLLAGSCPGQGRLTIDYSMFFERDPQHRVLASVRDERGVQTYIGTAANARLGGGTPGLLTTTRRFFREGVTHILDGYDHLAFVLLLLLPAVLRRDGGRWVPASSFRASLWHVAAIVTAFTVAHSLTLALAMLGWVSPASRVVEALIAGSVALAAANNLWPVVTRRLALIGFGFGLVHGFGFAGALGELGLPQDGRVAALLGFNLGVEAGQLLVVLALLPALYFLRERRWYARGGMQAVSAALGLVALAWLVERLG